ncbi:AAA family ATPase [Pelagibaculum spongiae]|uniref:ABC transporter ATP-binding protein n=1 Tax=Pelagibaculum spongiae TaxID=2080658 RepID=A0A2V1GU33_9GAMM|nr:AAA family ATPase [Pelagibaculum spongiae]PVZ66781.1 ABC transporter ATP-binding protein [Pelagibaculum spongiae]
MRIEKIHLRGYKSAADILLEDVSPFAVFAGPNGAGKSNLADGLAFFGQIVKSGAKQAISKAGGFKQIHCFKLPKKARTAASLELMITLKSKTYHYFVRVDDMDTKEPKLKETLSVDGHLVLDREDGLLKVKMLDTYEHNSQIEHEPWQNMPYPSDVSALMMKSDLPLYHFITNIRIFRFDPQLAKEPDSSSTQTNELDTFGRNVASMLGELLKNTDAREEITEWLELLVPGMEQVSTQKQKLDGSTALKFKEKGTAEPFPANLISDGTIYALCIMTGVLSRQGSLGMTFIEEPERGIHPQAIAELVSLMRDNASTDQPVFTTTHSESVVRSSKIDELWLVNKVNGKTSLKNAAKNSADLDDLNLDKAWLMNFFDGGLPW